MERKEYSNVETNTSNLEAKVYSKLEVKGNLDLDAKLYPDLETMCRLCLRENSGTVGIFTREKNSEKFATLSIPMRIMTCAALEVQDSDDFPKKICTQCRLQLEKSYYFRKMSQTADTKLRKHLRYIAMGKTSKVFNRNLEEDDDDEPEFQDSIDFIKEHEEQQKQIEKIKIDAFMNEMKLQNEQDLKNITENLKAKCREELIPLIKEEMRKVVQNELEENLRKDITEQCISQAKESLRSEVRDECRQLEIKCLLDDLQIYLDDKKKSSNLIIDSKRSPSPETIKVFTPKEKCIEENSSEVDVRMALELIEENVSKKNILTEDITEYDVATNDEECGSESNFLVYDIDGCCGVKKKSLENKFEYEEIVQETEFDEEYTDSNIITYEKIDENIYNDESGETTSTTSYRIADDEDGEIQFLKKNNDNSRNEVEEECPDSTNENIMIINIAEGVENVFVEQIEKVKDRKLSSSKSKKSPGQKAQTSRVTTTTSLCSETTFLTKTYVNPLQRSTDTAKIFKCDDCPMVFSTKPSLERHLRTHRKVEKTGIKFQCPECRIVVSCSSALRRHMYVHCDEKPFSCNICDKAFVQKEILKRHMQTHTGIKPHQCPHCERSFAQRINLTQHINRTHLKEPHIQQHPCYLCPKRFNHASGLSRHLATHSGVAFQCSECGRTFADRSSIKRHIISIHSNARLSKSDIKAKMQ